MDKIVKSCIALADLLVDEEHYREFQHQWRNGTTPL
jgi:hypothetical protein